MKKKYYAVREGRKPGVYLTWAECEKQVKGHAGAVYKAFFTEEEARCFVLGDTLFDESGFKKKIAAKSWKMPLEEEAENVKKTKRGLVGRQGKLAKENLCDVVAYIDGSFDSDQGIIGYGGIIFYKGEEILFSKGTNEDEYISFWNVAGELLAARHVISFALEKNATSCAIFYDYAGIEMWATGRWKANNPLTQSYVSFVKDAEKKIRLEFHKVAAHQGDKYNELVDSLAKKGIEEKKYILESKQERESERR